MSDFSQLKSAGTDPTQQLTSDKDQISGLLDELRNQLPVTKRKITNENEPLNQKAPVKESGRRIADENTGKLKDSSEPVQQSPHKKAKVEDSTSKSDSSSSQTEDEQSSQENQSPPKTKPVRVQSDITTLINDREAYELGYFDKKYNDKGPYLALKAQFKKVPNWGPPECKDVNALQESRRTPRIQCMLSGIEPVEVVEAFFLNQERQYVDEPQSQSWADISFDMCLNFTGRLSVWARNKLNGKFPSEIWETYQDLKTDVTAACARIRIERTKADHDLLTPWEALLLDELVEETEQLIPLVSYDLTIPAVLKNVFQLLLPKALYELSLDIGFERWKEIRDWVKKEQAENGRKWA